MYVYIIYIYIMYTYEYIYLYKYIHKHMYASMKTPETVQQATRSRERDMADERALRAPGKLNPLQTLRRVEQLQSMQVRSITESVYEAVLQKSIPAQIRQLNLHCSYHTL